MNPAGFIDEIARFASRVPAADFWFGVAVLSAGMLGIFAWGWISRGRWDSTRRLLEARRNYNASQILR